MLVFLYECIFIALEHLCYCLSVEELNFSIAYTVIEIGYYLIPVLCYFSEYVTRNDNHLVLPERFCVNVSSGAVVEWDEEIIYILHYNLKLEYCGLEFYEYLPCVVFCLGFFTRVIFLSQGSIGNSFSTSRLPR